MQNLSESVAPPPLNMPASDQVVNLRVIDTAARVAGLPAAYFLDPRINGCDEFSGPSYSFLVEHEASGTKVLFDLGISKSWESGAPRMVGLIRKLGFKVSVDRSVSELLVENGIPLESISSVIWSHWHWDHTGDPSLFPPTTSLTVGPGFKAAMLPGYPTNPDSPILESAYKGRDLVEISFDQTNLQIGGFRAFDYFGDGSFYLLDSPGHAVGHICGLARTTPDTFVFLGGDICHHGGQLRPTPYLPLPKQISPNPFQIHRNTIPCPGALLLSIHPNRSATEPFYRIPGPLGAGGNAINIDPAEAQNSLNKLHALDGHEDVLTIIAHDDSLLGVLDFFPKSLNDWKVKKFREQGMWGFLSYFTGAVGSEGTPITS